MLMLEETDEGKSTKQTKGVTDSGEKKKKKKKITCLLGEASLSSKKVLSQ
jgi:hypothetical protein